MSLAVVPHPQGWEQQGKTFPKEISFGKEGRKGLINILSHSRVI